MISAFTLFSSSKVRFAADALPKTSFYVRRAFRILPLWWLATAIYAYRGGFGWRGWIPAALMYFGFIRYRRRFDVFQPGWSIFVEETFYVLLPFVFSRITDLRRSIMFVAASCAVAIAWDQLAAKLGVPATRDFVFLFPFNQWFCIAIGIALFFLSEDPFFRSAFIDNRDWAGIYDALAAVAFFTLVRQSHMAASLGLAVLFIVSMSPHTLFGRLARNRWLGKLGIACYSIYLLHPLVLGGLAPHLESAFVRIGMAGATRDVRFLLALPLFALASLAMGLTVWHGFERPCIQLGRQINARLSRRAGAV